MSLRRWFIRVLFLCLLVLLAAPFWALGTTSGLRGMLAFAGRMVPAGGLTVGAVGGSLAEGAELSGIALHTPSFSLTLDRLVLGIDLAALFRRELHLEHIGLGELRLHLAADDSPSSPLTTLPSLPVLPIGIRLDELTLAALEIKPPEGTAQRLQRLGAAFRWPRGGALELRELSLSHATTDLTVAGHWGEQRPDALALELHWRHQLDAQLFAQGSGKLEGAGEALRLTQEVVAPVKVHLEASLTLPAGAAPWSLKLELPPGQTLPAVPAGLPLKNLGAQLRATGTGDGATSAQLDSQFDLGPYGAWTLAAQAAGRSAEAIGLEFLRVKGPGDAVLELQGRVNAPAATVELTGAWRALRWPLDGPASVLSPGGQLSLAGGLEQINYRLEADTRLNGGPAATWRLQGNATPTRAVLETLALQTGPGRADFTGWLDWSAVPSLKLDGRWRQLEQVLPDGQRVRSAAGTLQLAGTAEAWTASSAFDLQVGRYPRGALRAELGGSTSSVQFKTLRADFKGGQLSATGEAAWGGATPRWSVQARARDFNPAMVLPDWAGRLAFDLETAGSVNDFTLSLQRLGGELRGLELRGDAALARKGEVLTVPRLSLAAGEAMLEASGGVGRSQRLRWSLEVPAVAALWPAGAGTLSARGELAGALPQPAASGELKARGLRLPGLAVQEAALDWDVDLRSAAEQHLNARIAGLEAGGRTLSGELAVQGPLSALVVALRTQLAADEHLSLGMNGALALDPPRWRGSLTTGEWLRGTGTRMTLEAPAALQVGAAGAAVERQCWRGEGRLCLAASARADGVWQAEVESDALLLEALPRISEWQRGALSGALAANGNGAVLEKAAGRFTLAPTQWTLDDEDLPPIGHRGVTLAVATTGEGLTLELDAALDRPAALATSLELTLPGGPWDLTAPGAQALSGRLRANAPDLAPWAAYSDEVAELAGKASLDFGLTGSLAEPAIDGGAVLDLPRVQLTRLGIELKDVAVKLAGGRDHELRVDGRLRSGPGTAQVSGTVSMLADGMGADLRIVSDDLQVIDLPMASVRATSRLDFDLFPTRAVLKGEVTIPKAQLNVRATNARTERSDDVIADEDDAAIRRAFALESDLWIVLGDEVKLEAMGLAGRLAGRLHLMEQARQAMRASGELRIEEGHYTQWGQDLNLRNSRVIYTGQAITDPGVDARAERTIGEVTAGLRVSGRLLEPVARLYSTPAMADTDVLSYLVAGQPLGKASSTDANALMGAAASLGLRGSGMLTDRIAHTFGLDEIKVGGNPNDKNLALTVGKYLSPRLYVGYGMGLVDNVNTFRLRYSLGKRWNVEAETGSRSSADLLYTIER